jgi:hypothetical protein
MKKNSNLHKLIRWAYDPRIWPAEKSFKEPREGFSKSTKEKALARDKIRGCPECGKPLKSNIHHHHKNLNRTDNSLKNDMPLHKHCHSRLHEREKVVREKIGYEHSTAPPTEKHPELQPIYKKVIKKKN